MGDGCEKMNVLDNILGNKRKEKKPIVVNNKKKIVYKDSHGNKIIKGILKPSGKVGYYGEDKNGKRLKMIPFVKLAKEAKILY